MDRGDTTHTADADFRLRAYVAALAALALVLGASLAYRYGLEVGWRFAVGTPLAAGLLLLADAFPVRAGGRHEVNAVDIGLVVSVAVLGPLWAAAAALPLALILARRGPLRAAYEAACTTAEVCVAGAIFLAASEPLLSEGSAGRTTPIVYGTLLAGTALVCVNHAANAGLLRIKYGLGPRELWEELAGPYLVPHALNILTAGLGVAALVSYGPPAALVLVAGSVGSQALAYRAHAQAGENRALREENLALKRGLVGAGETFASLVVEALGRKDGSSDRRAAATAVYARDVALEMDLGNDRAESIRLAGLLLDVGMTFLPEELLLAGGRPNSVAKARLSEHPELGERALAAMSGYGDVARWVRWHHERPDGRGYPDKLKGPWIPVEAKILAVAQAYASLVIDGPTQPGVGPAQARERLTSGMDTEFDGLAVKALLRILDTEGQGYRMADDHRFVLPGSRAGRGDGGANVRMARERGEP